MKKLFVAVLMMASASVFADYNNGYTRNGNPNDPAQDSWTYDKNVSKPSYQRNTQDMRYGYNQDMRRPNPQNWNQSNWNPQNWNQSNWNPQNWNSQNWSNTNPNWNRSRGSSYGNTDGSTGWFNWGGTSNGTNNPNPNNPDFRPYNGGTCPMDDGMYDDQNGYDNWSNNPYANPQGPRYQPKNRNLPSKSWNY